MPSNPFFSNVSRQVIGGVAGMAAATLLYFSIQNLTSGTSSMKGLLVDTTTVSQHAAQIRVNDKNIDDATLRTIARRAQTVATLVEQSKKDAPVPTAVAAPTDAAKQRATFIAARKALAATRGTSAAALTSNVKTNQQAAVVSADAAVHAAAPKVPSSVHPAGLPSSGPALPLLIITSCFGAFFAVRRDLLSFEL